jgi:hypothetical protein
MKHPKYDEPETQHLKAQLGLPHHPTPPMRGCSHGLHTTQRISRVTSLLTVGEQ